MLSQSPLFTPTTLPPVYCSIQYIVSGKAHQEDRGPYLVLSPRLLLGLRENLLHRQVKWKGPFTPCGQQHLLQCLTEETDWQKSRGGSIFLRSLLQLLFLSLFHPSVAHG